MRLFGKKKKNDSQADEHHYPYEPTPYKGLERLIESGYMNERSQVMNI